MTSITRGLAVALLAMIIGIGATAAYRHYVYFQFIGEWRQNLEDGVSIHQRHYKSFGGDLVFTQISTYPSVESARSSFEDELREASEIVRQEPLEASDREIFVERVVFRNKPNRHGARSWCVALLRDREIFLICGPVQAVVLEMERRAKS